MFFIAYAFKGPVHVFCRKNENCKSLVLQYKCNIEIFLSPVLKCHEHNGNRLHKGSYKSAQVLWNLFNKLRKIGIM